MIVRVVSESLESLSGLELIFLAPEFMFGLTSCLRKKNVVKIIKPSMCKKRTFPQNLIAWSLFKFWVSQINWYFTLFAYKQLYYLLWGVFIPCFPRKTKSEGVQEQQLSPHHSSLFYIKVCFVSNYCIISTFLPAPLKLLLWYLSNMERPNKQIY